MSASDAGVPAEAEADAAMIAAHAAQIVVAGAEIAEDVAGIAVPVAMRALMAALVPIAGRAVPAPRRALIGISAEEAAVAPAADVRPNAAIARIRHVPRAVTRRTI